MNFNLLHLQRKFTVLCSAAGVVSIFLPWVSVSGGFINVSLNGFRGFGIVAFIAYGLSVLFSVLGNQQERLDKKMWLSTLVSGTIALLVTVVALGNNTADSGLGFIKAEYGIGVWVSLAASLGLIFFTWKYKHPEDSLKGSLDEIKNSFSEPVQSSSVSSPNNPLNELERLITLRDSGKLSSDEFDQMKSRIIK